MKSQSTPDIDLDKTIKTLDELCDKLYKQLLAIQKNKEINSKTKKQEMLALEKKILKLSALSKEFTSYDNNDALLIYIKTIILCGHHAGISVKKDTAFDYYYRAYQYLNNHPFLKYEHSLSFQNEIDNAFFELTAIIELKKNQYFFSIPSRKINNALTELQTKSDEINIIHKQFEQKCKNTIIGLERKYTTLCNLYVHGYRNQHNLMYLNAFYKNNREDFFNLARNIKNSLESKKLNRTFTTEDSIYYLKLNYLMLIISDITHPRSIWKIDITFDNLSFKLINPVKLEELKEYLNFWIALKTLYITPSLSHIKNINTDELNNNIKLHHLYLRQLDKWLSYFHMPTTLCLAITTDMIDLVESKPNSLNNFYNDVCELIIKMQPEIDYLTTGIADIESAAKLHCHDFDGDLITESNKISKQNLGLNDKINALKANIDLLKQKKLMLANKFALELIHEEEERKILHNEKIQKRKKPIEHVPILQKKTEESDSENEAELDTLNLISEELLELQLIDKTAFDLAYHLQSKSLSICKMLESRLRLSVPLTSNQHEKVYKKISYMLAEYYQLIALYEKHKCLSQENTITETIDIQDGILFSQETLVKISLSIHENIQSVIELINKMKEMRKISRDKKIYDLGIEYTNKHPDTHFTHDQIIQYGREEFKYIGKNKSDVSEHTKLKRFLNTTKYTFSALVYLQERIKPFIFENCNKTPIDIGFFNHTDLWQAQFHGLLGCIFQSKFIDSNDTSFLSEAFTHFETSYAAFSRANDMIGMQDVAERLEGVKMLLDQNGVVNKLSG